MNDHRTIIEADRLTPLTLSELWRYRELFLILAWRTIIVRYKQTFFGVVWALIRPVATMVIFSVLFGRIAGLPGLPGVPYPILVFSGVLVWQFFAGMISAGGDALVGNRGLVTKVYFPRVVIPVSALVVCMIDFLLAAAVFFVLYAVFCPGAFSWRLLWLPPALLPLILTALGIVLFFSAMNVRYRDFRHIIPFLLQLGLFITPVGFSGAVIPERWQVVARLNPVYGVVGMVRWSLFGAELDPAAAGISLFWALLLPVIGIRVFRWQEKSFSDYI